MREMRPSVTAILVAHDSAAFLERTIAALEAQTVRPDRIAMVNLESSDDTLALMRDAGPDLLVTVEADTSFGAAIAAAIEELAHLEPPRERAAADEPNDWYWLLSADNAPDRDALEALLDTAERNPSLEATGPKLVRADDPAVVAELGETLTASGARVLLNAGELDQGQFEGVSDVLAVAANGMLVRRETWERLGGFDPGLDAVDDALDFCVRVWLSDGRVVAAPQARVETAGDEAPGTERLGRHTSPLTRYRLDRTAQLHRQLAWSSPFGFFLRWLALLPQALGRAVLHLLRKQPDRILPDLRAALTVMFGATGAGAARKRAAATRRQPLSSIERLRLSRSEQRTRQAALRDESRATLQHSRDRFNFITGGGGWVLLVGAIASAVLLFPLLRTATITGGALLPLSRTLGELWANTGYGLRDAGGATGAADPFQFLLAVLGSVTFWHPSLIVVVIWLIAIPASAVGMWFLLARLTTRAWVRAWGALAWAIAPMLFGALADGRLQAVLVHILLPWLMFTGFAASRSWAQSAVTSLLATVIAACSPMLIPALGVLWFVAMLRSGRGWIRHVFLPLPALALFLPLVVAQINRGRPLAIFADPGAPALHDPVLGWHAALGFPDAHFGGWPKLLDALGQGALPVPLVLAALLVPLGVLALVGILSPGWRVAFAGLLVAAVGFVTAGIAGGVEFAVVGATGVPLWGDAAQSLGFFGLLLAAAAGAAHLGPLRGTVTTVALLALIALVAPIGPAQLTGTSDVAATDGRTLPAIIDAQGAAAPRLGTLIITPLDADSLRVHLERGTGETLDDVSTLATTNLGMSDGNRELAKLAVDFLGSGAVNPTEQLHRYGIGFILVEPGTTGGGALEQRMLTALSTSPAVSEVGAVEAYGTVFQVVNAAEAPTDAALNDQLATSNWQTLLGRTMLIVQIIVLVFVILLALPTGGVATRARAAIASGPRWEDLDHGRSRRRRKPTRVDDERVEIYADAASGELTEEPGAARD